MNAEATKLIKHSGQVFTPAYLVNNILDYVGYEASAILQKHVIDNSCGDGAFLCEVVTRYCKEYIYTRGTSTGLKNDFEKYIHGIEIENVAYANCIYNLNKTVERFGITDVKWDILNENALRVVKYNSQMDFVVGNPPYVRVHNLGDGYDLVKSFAFAQDGMPDMYLVFFELGLKMLNATGRLCYITPSSWLSSLAATNMRRYIRLKQTLVGVVDLGHYQAFENATTYTMISRFDADADGGVVEYCDYDVQKRDKVYVDTLSYSEMCVGDDFCLATKKELSELKNIYTKWSKKYVSVKNGFATLADKVFIQNVPFHSFTIPVLKASTGKWYRGFFPYDKNGKPLPKETIFADKEVAEYLSTNKETLLKDKNEKQKPDWYLYGRTQALKDVFAYKMSVNSIVRDVSTIKLMEVPVGAGVYSGLYILTNVPYDVIEKTVRSDDFMAYAKALKNYKSGGYYTYTSKDLERFLNYKLTNDEDLQHFIPIDKHGVSASCLELF